MGTATIQGDLWGRDPQRWATHLEAAMRPLYEITLNALEPLAGTSLLDAGCGSGLVVRLAADRGATVSGLDASAHFVEYAQARTPTARCEVGDVQELPYPDDTFDTVTAFNSMQYAADPAAAIAELARVCRPGGQVAVGLWGDARRCEAEGLFARLRSLAPPPPGAAAPLALSDPGVVEDLLEKAGLDVTGAAETPISFTFEDLDQAWLAHSSAGPLQKIIDLVGPDAVRSVVDEVVEADRKPDGTLRQDNVMRYVRAGKPT